jgi:ABC-type nitrate/sulfonate/bicarbonate transport system ATPase subunit
VGEGLIEMDSTPKLRIVDVVKDYGETRALDHVSFDVAQGDFVCLVGASGCGKSTLLNIISGLEVVSTGAVEVDGEGVIGPGPDRGMVFQAYSLYPWKTVWQNVAFGLELAKIDRQTQAKRIEELLEVMGISDFANHYPSELSGGMRQRVAIARALAPEPDVLLLDEPFGALDALTKRNLQEFLRQVWLRTGTTIVMVTHDVAEAIYLSQRICVMTPRPGRLAEIIDIPFGSSRDATTKRDPRFLDLVDEIEETLHADLQPELQA